MRKSDLVTIVARKINREYALPEPAIKAVINAALETIVEGVGLGESVTLRTFGTFAPKTRAPKTARDITRGQVIHLPAKTVMSFKPAKEIIQNLNP